MKVDPPLVLALLALALPGQALAAAAAWNVEAVDVNEDVGTYAAITVDAQNRIVVAYRDETNRTLKIRRTTATGWSPPLIPPDDSANFGLWPSIVTDSARVHVVYHERPGDGGPGPYLMRYAVWDGAQWSLQTVFYGGPFASLALDSQGVPHVAFVDSPGLFATYATLAGQTWDVDIFDFLDAAAYTSLSLDRTGAIHVAYIRLGFPTALVHATLLPGGSWDLVEVLSDPNVGPSYSSLVVDELDRVHIAFHDAYGGTLVYYLRDGADETFTVIDSGGVGEYASMKLDASLVPHIAYYDFARQDLKYVRGDDWVPMVVDSAGAVGQWASLALDAGGQPHIAYHDATLGHLKHAWLEPPLAADARPPQAAGLLTVRPNPFRVGGHVVISLTLEQPVAADLVVYDVQGRLVRTLLAGELGAGTHAVGWDGRPHAGAAPAAGVYFLRLRAGEAESRSKVVLVR